MDKSTVDAILEDVRLTPEFALSTTQTASAVKVKVTSGLAHVTMWAGEVSTLRSRVEDAMKMIKWMDDLSWALSRKVKRCVPATVNGLPTVKVHRYRWYTLSVIAGPLNPTKKRRIDPLKAGRVRFSYRGFYDLELETHTDVEDAAETLIEHFNRWKPSGLQMFRQD